jgi:hypothetical protein
LARTLSREESLRYAAFSLIAVCETFFMRVGKWRRHALINNPFAPTALRDA